MTTIFNDVNLMTRALNYHLDRGNAISANIVNVDTPGYAPRELERPDSKEGESFSMVLARTSEKHIAVAGAGTTESGYEVVEERNVVPGNDLNYVSLDHEMARMNTNSLRYEAVTKLVSFQLGVLRYAATNASRG